MITIGPAGLAFDRANGVQCGFVVFVCPWLKFRRKTSAPASNSVRIISGLLLAGPSVAMIFAERRRLIQLG